jgi:hypothetical protein
VTRWVLALVLMGSGGAQSALPPVQLTLSGGRISLSASDARVADVVTRWAQEGHAQLAGVEYLGARRITIRLSSTSEADALKAIVGSPNWYTTVARDTPAASESTFERITILPAAAAAAGGLDQVPPEARFAYGDNSDRDAAALAHIAQAVPAPQTPAARRPPDVEPEAFYTYGATLETEATADLALTPSRQPLHPIAPNDPETVYTYASTTAVTDPIVSSNLKPETPALEPEQRFTYSSTTPAPTTSVDGIPDLPVMTGFAGLQRLPGHAYHYVIER